LKLAGRGVLDLAKAWALVSTNPATAAGLTDRGAIAEGLRADLVLIDPNVPRIVATIVGGQVAHITANGAARMT
jgi:alpha-D-ribose 1-methylphosphonate 5-triphosphate diphosphatase